MIPGLIYIPNFITDGQQKYIIQDLDERPWSNELKRRVQHYGYKYDYTKKSINESMKVDDLPKWMKIYAHTFVNRKYFETLPDQAIVNEYAPGQGISKHIDCTPCFKNNIASISLLSGCTMEFSKGNEVRELYLEPKSLLVISDEARYEWHDAIPARLKDNDKPRERRVSVTFRSVIVELLNN